MTDDRVSDNACARKLERADTSAWYVLATIHGEQGETKIDEELHLRNRRTWNRLVSGELTDEEKNALKKRARIDPEDLVPFSEAERAALEAWVTTVRGVSIPPIPRETTVPKASRETAFTLTDLLFDKRFYVEGFIFPASVDFQGSCFQKEVSFSNVTVQGVFRFQRAEFCETASFDGAVIVSWADFEGVRFCGDVRFQRAVFEGEADFEKAIFEKDASFFRCAFEDRTDFTKAEFALVPDFRHTTLAFSTFWDNVDWPQPSTRPDGDTDDAKKKHRYEIVEAENRYAALRYAMNQTQRFRDELDFLVCELKAKRIYSSLFKKIVIGAYLIFSDGGRSVVRPLLWWAGLAFVMFFVNGRALAPAYPFNIFSSFGAEVLRFTLGSAFVVATPIFDHGKQNLFQTAFNAAVDSNTVGAVDIPFSLLMVGLLHTGLSAVFLFLVGLGIRNWLRMR